MLNEKDIEILIERLHYLEMTNKGFTTRIRLLESDVDKLKEQERKRL